jgi:hypothetical protein
VRLHFDPQTRRFIALQPARSWALRQLAPINIEPVEASAKTVATRRERP